MLQASIQLYKNAYSGIPRPVWWLSLVIFINRSGAMVIPFLTVYLTIKGWSLTEAGTIMAIFGIGAIAGGYLGGWLTDRIGAFRVQFFSLFFNGVLFILLGYMTALWQIGVVVFFLSCIGEAFRPANAAAIASHSNPANRTRCYSLNRLAINLGWSIGPALGGILAGISYQLLFWADGITCILAAFLLYYFMHSGNEAKAATICQEEKKSGQSAFGDTVFLKTMGLIVLVGIAFFQLFNIIPVYYRDAVGMSVTAIGWVLALNGLVIVLLEMVIVYSLENKRKVTIYMCLGTFLMGLSFLTLAVSPLLSMVLLSMLFITFGEMLLFPFTNNFWVARTTPANRGSYAAAYTMSFAIAHVMSPLLASFIARTAGFPTLFVFDFILCTIAALGFLFIGKTIE